MVKQIVEFGVPERQAIFALRETHYRGVDEAIGFIYDNAEKCNDTAGMTRLLPAKTQAAHTCYCQCKFCS